MKVEEILEKHYQKTASQEELEFLHSRLSDSEIEEALKFYGDIEAISDYHRHKKALKYVKENLTQKKAVQKKLWHKKEFWIAILFACLIAFLAYVSLFQSKEETKLSDAYATFYHPLNIELNTVTRGNNTIDPELKSVQDAYLKRKYDKVLAISGTSELDKVELYRGLALMANNQWDSAESVLLDIKNTHSTGLLKEIAEWYLCLISLKQDDLNESLNRLNHIRASEKHTYKSKADELYSMLDNE